MKRLKAIFRSSPSKVTRTVREPESDDGSSHSRHSTRKMAGFAPGVDPPPPEYSWSADGDLKGLWQTYVEVIDDVDKRGPALNAVTARVLTEASGVEVDPAYFLSNGHPVEMLRVLAAHFPDACNALKKQLDQTRELAETSHEVTMLRLLGMLAKFRANRQRFQEELFLTSLQRLIVDLVRSYPGVTSTVPRNVVHEGAFESVLSGALRICKHFLGSSWRTQRLPRRSPLQATEHFCGSLATLLKTLWGKQPVRSGMPLPEAPGGPAGAGGPGGSEPHGEDVGGWGGNDWVTESPQQVLMHLLLDVIGGVMCGDSGAQRIFCPPQKGFCKADIMTPILSLVGWPQDYVPGGDGDTTKDHARFEIQLRCLHVLRALCNGQPFAVDKLHAANGLESLMESIMWVFVTFSGDETPVEQATQLSRAERELDELEATRNVGLVQPPSGCNDIATDEHFATCLKPGHSRGRSADLPLECQLAVLNKCAPLDRLFDDLLLCCIAGTQEGEEDNEEEEHRGNKARVKNKEREPKHHTRTFAACVMQIVLDLFGQKQSSQHSAWARIVFQESRFPLLQQHVLSFIQRAIVAHPPLMSVCREERLYTTLFGNNRRYFFFSGDQVPDAGAPAEANALLGWEPGRCWNLLQRQVLELMLFTATCNASSNSYQCCYLLGVLQECCNDDAIIIRVANCLLSILRARRTKTLRTLFRQDFPKIISDVIKTQKQASATLALRANPTRAQLPKARLRVVMLLDYYLSHDQAKLSVLRNWKAVEVIGNLITEPGPLRHYGLRLTTALMVAVQPNLSLSARKSPKRTLLQKRGDSRRITGGRSRPSVDSADIFDWGHHMAEYIPKLQKTKSQLFWWYMDLLPLVVEDVRLVKAMLAGIRDVLSINTKHHQGIFQRRKCFRRIIALFEDLVPEETPQDKQVSARHKTVRREMRARGSSIVGRRRTAFSQDTEREVSEHQLPQTRLEPAIRSPRVSSTFPAERDSVGMPVAEVSLVQQEGSPSPQAKRSREYGTEMSMHVLQTLAVLMANHPKNQESFQKNVGYEVLGNLLLRAEHGRPSRELFDALFAMLVEGVPGLSSPEHPPDTSTNSVDPAAQLSPRQRAEGSPAAPTKSAAATAPDTMREKYIFENPEVVWLMFELLPHCEKQHQLDFLNFFTSMVSRSVLNQAECAKANIRVIDSVLNLFPKLTNHLLQDPLCDPFTQRFAEKLITLIRILGSHSITVKEIKRFFALINSRKALIPIQSPQGTVMTPVQTRPSYGPLLLEAVEAMTHKQGPENFFYFDGAHSGLETPALENSWPPKGYSFSMWIRIESYNSPAVGANLVDYHQPRLLKFMTEKHGDGVELFFDRRHVLTVKVTTRNDEYFANVDTPLDIQEWYHIAITHSPSLSLSFGTPKLRIYIDGVLHNATDLVKYPSASKALRCCCIGTDNRSHSPQAFYGQMGPFYMFNDAISPENVKLIYQLGSSYMFTFTTETLRESGKALGSKGGVPRTPSSRSKPTQLTSKIHLAYNAKARDGNLFLDTAPRRSSTRKRGMHATPLPGTHQCVTRHVKHVMHCLGGIQVLFPLFTQLDQAVYRGVYRSDKGQKLVPVLRDSRPEGQPEEANTPSLGADAAAMIPSEGQVQVAAEGRSEGQGEPGGPPEPGLPPIEAVGESGEVPRCNPRGPEKKASGFSKLKVANPYNSPKLVYTLDHSFLLNTLRVFTVMAAENEVHMNFLEKASGFALIGMQLERASPLHFTIPVVDAMVDLVEAVSARPALLRDSFFHLLCNFRLWIYTPVHVQNRWLNKVNDTVRKFPKLIRESHGVQELLDSLRLLCWFKREPDSQATQANLFHKVTRQCIGSRPDVAQLCIIRQQFMSIIKAGLNTDGGVQLGELQSMIFYLQHCSDDQQKEDVLRLVLWLLRNQTSVVLKHLTKLDEPVDPAQGRLAGSNLFLRLLHSPLLKIRVLAVQGIQCLLRDASIANPDLLLAMEVLLLQHRVPLDQSLYHALFSILTGDEVDEKTRDTARDSGRLAQPQVLRIILKLLVKMRTVAVLSKSEIKLLPRVMQDLVFLVNNDLTRSAIRSDPQWPSFFFDLMIPPVYIKSTDIESPCHIPPEIPATEIPPTEIPVPSETPSETPSPPSSLATSSLTHTARPLDMTAPRESLRSGFPALAALDIPERSLGQIVPQVSSRSPSSKRSPRPTSTARPSHAKDRDTVRAYAMNLFTNLVFCALKHKDGWECFRTSMAWLSAYSKQSIKPAEADGPLGAAPPTQPESQAGEPSPSDAPSSPSPRLSSPSSPYSSPPISPQPVEGEVRQCAESPQNRESPRQQVSAGLPVLCVLLHVLEDMYKFLVSEAEKRDSTRSDLSVLVVNVNKVLELAQNFLLSHVTAHGSFTLQPPSPIHASPSHSPLSRSSHSHDGVNAMTQSGVSVWAMLQVMSELRAWVSPHPDCLSPSTPPARSKTPRSRTSRSKTPKPKSTTRPNSEAPIVQLKRSQHVICLVLRVMLCSMAPWTADTCAVRHLFASPNVTVLCRILRNVCAMPKGISREQKRELLVPVHALLRQVLDLLHRLHPARPMGESQQRDDGDEPEEQVKFVPLSAALTDGIPYVLVLAVTILSAISTFDFVLSPAESDDEDAGFVQASSSASQRMSLFGSELQQDDMVTPLSRVVIHKIPTLQADLLEVPSLNPEDLLPWQRECTKHLVYSQEWRDAARTLAVTTRSIYSAGQSECQTRTKSFKVVVTALSRTYTRLHREEQSSFQAMNTQLERARITDERAENQRRMNCVKRRSRLRQNRARTWRFVVRALTNERGPWNNSWDDDGEHTCYWRLDECENKHRMRVKVRINHFGHNHSDASQGAQDQPSEDLQEKEKLERERNKMMKLALKYVKPVSITEPEAEEDVREGEDERVLKKEAELDWDLEDEDEDEEAEEDEAKVLMKCECSMMMQMQACPGQLVITSATLAFDPLEVETPRKDRGSLTLKERARAALDCYETGDRRWRLAEIQSMHYRRYQLRRNAMEIFFEDQLSYFFTFKDEEERNTVHTKLRRLLKARKRAKAGLAAGGQPTRQQDNFNFNYHYSGNMTGAELLKKSGLTLAWRQRKISNFDYLMHLNTIAGRTYNDLTQYPVFPWIIADYESEILDLTDPASYRDLSKPMGALNPERLKMYQERYKSLEDPLTMMTDDEEGSSSMPPFHYGTHYSSAGTVLFYLIRTEPFTTQGILLQDGKFDHPDRMFNSLPNTWKGCLSNPADVKELIPEFFYLPEMLRNVNQFNLGMKQKGQELGDVILPPWAKTPEDFIRLNRQALESEYVSKRLHLWINLIFGYQQIGPEAVKAHNVFFYLTYEGMCDIDTIDPALRDATLAQIEHFGQTPTQLLTKNHAPRESPDDQVETIFARLKDLHFYKSFQVTAKQKGKADNPLLFVHHCHLRIITLGLDRVLGIHKWNKTVVEYVPPFSFDVEVPKKSAKPRRIGVHFAVGLNIYPFFFAVSACERYVLSCGHWNNSFQVSNLDTGVVVHSISAHQDIVTCIAISEKGEILATGSKDTTVMLWELDNGEATNDIPDGSYINPTPKHVLYGHDDEVLCVAVNSDLDVVVSASKDGSCIIHTLRKGRYVRSMYPPGGAPLRWVGISSQGYIVVYTAGESTLHLYSINGDHLCSKVVGEKLYAMLFSQDGQFLVTGGKGKEVIFRSTHNLKRVGTLGKGDCWIRSLASTPQEQHLLVGLQTGEIHIYALNANYLRKRFLKRLTTLGF